MSICMGRFSVKVLFFDNKKTPDSAIRGFNFQDLLISFDLLQVKL